MKASSGRYGINARTLVVLSGLLGLAIGTAYPASGSESRDRGRSVATPVNTPVDITFNTSHAAPNAYLEEPPLIEFRGPGRQTGRGRAFWDGKGRFVFRFAPTAAGVWRYRVHSSYADLNGGTGEILGTQPGRPGFVGVDPRYPRAFRRETGERFYWLGDTAWNLLAKASLDQVREYARIRRAQGFNIVQLSTQHHSRAGPAANEGGPMFLDGDLDRVNPEYFRAADAKMRALTQQRLVPVVFLTWGNEVGAFKPGQFERFIRYVVARYAAFDILWSLSGEWDYSRERLDDWQRWGALLQSEDPYRHLISVHGQQTATSLQSFADQSWLGFSLQQTYIHTGLVHPMALEDRKRGKPMPIVSAEAEYEGGHYRRNPTPTDLVRRNAWAAVTGGAFVTYGAEGIWDFHPEAWRAAMTLPGALQVAAIGRLMRAQEWWTMGPADDRLDVAGGEAFCLAGPKSWIVYVNPGESGFHCSVTLERPMRLRWFDPRAGAWAGSETSVTPGALPLRPPGPGDWVAVLS